MKIADLSPQTFERLKKWRYDSIVEKHEGPWDYAGVFTYGNPEFMEMNGKTVLLPWMANSVQMSPFCGVSKARTAMC